MTRTPEQRAEFRRIATEFVTAVNARTYCAHCGSQPIEWHGEHHPQKPNHRVSALRTQGHSIARIQAEMDICTPLCRICHMKEDGRIAALIASHYYKKGQMYVAPKPCVDCGRATKPTRRGRCNHCYIKFMGIR